MEEDSMATALESLIQGDSTLAISLEADAGDLREIQAVLEEKVAPALEHVRICGDEFAWYIDGILVFHTISKLETVKRLEVRNFMPNQGGCALSLLPMGLSLMDLGPRLEELELASVVIKAERPGIETRFLQKIEAMQSLRRLVFTGTIAAEDCRGYLDRLAIAISTLPSLQELDIQTQWWEMPGVDSSFDHLSSGQALDILCSNPNIRELTLGDFHTGNEVLSRLSGTIQTYPNIHSLRLAFADQAATLRSEPLLLGLVKGLAAKDQGLRILKLHFFFGDQMDLVDSVILALLKALSNSNLKAVEVGAVGFFSKPSIQDTTTHLLESNYVLESLDIHNNPEGDGEGVNPEDFVEGSSLGKRPHLDLLLQLNRLGRGALLTNRLSREQWVMEFSKLGNDLDALNYYLGQNLWLCCTRDQQVRVS